jgi:hypothetical protein
MGELMAHTDWAGTAIGEATRRRRTSRSPTARSATRRVGDVFTAVFETTDRVLGARRLGER